MRKALLPMIASLALCGGATAALIATNARAAQTPRKPVMIALVSHNDMEDDAAPPADGGAPGMDAMGAPDRAAHRAQFCKDMYAHKVGELAFLEAKLSLTPAQQPLFGHWRQVSLDIAHSHQDECTGRAPHKRGERPSVLDRMDREETMLKQRLSDLQAERPALQALYDSLTPQQKAEFGRGGMGGRPMMRGMMGRHMMMGMMDRPHPPGMGPPPPPGGPGPDGPPPLPR